MAKLTFPTSSLMFCLILCVPSSFAQLTWSLLTNTTGPGGLRDHAVGFDGAGQRVVVFGGRTANGVSGETWIYNINNSSWEQVASTPSPPARFSMVYGMTGNNFYITTGQKGSQLYNDVWKFDIGSKTWEEIKPSGVGPAALYGAAGGIFQNTSALYVSHGFDTAERYASTYKYDILKNQWSQVHFDGHSYGPEWPHARCLHSGTMVTDTKLVIFGGCLSGGKTGGPCPGFDSWIFDTTSQTWQRIKDCISGRTYSSMARLPPGRSNMVTADPDPKSTGIRVVLYGGNEQSSQVLKTDEMADNEVGVLNFETAKWSIRKTEGAVIPLKRIGAAMFTAPELGGILMVGGSSKSGYHSDIWLLQGNSSSADNTIISSDCGGLLVSWWNLIVLHTIFMFSGWGILLQAGAFIARYFRWKDPLWFTLHRICQVSGLLFAIAGFICAVFSVRFDHFNFAHGVIGLIVMIIGLLQPLNALIRPHVQNEEPKSQKRKIWEFFHINVGRVALIFALINITLGMYLEVATQSTFILWYVYLAVIVIAYIVMEIRHQYKAKKQDHAAIQMEDK